jgi:hypothetical protein
MCRSSLDGNRELPRLASCGAPLCITPNTSVRGDEIMLRCREPRNQKH